MSHIENQIDPKAFRRALGNFATGVTVITAQTPEGIKTGVTANSFNSVSLEPALILWSIDKRSGSCEIFKQATHFAVNILAADQIDISNHFARTSDDKFVGIEYTKGHGGAPLFPHTAACFQCESYETHDGGDHWILIGKVIRFDDSGRAPLLYHQGGYAAVIPHSRSVVQQEDSSLAIKRVESRLENNFYYLMLKALRAYQEDYEPSQLSTGLRTSEARMLMVLQETSKLSRSKLFHEIYMPDTDVNTAAGILESKGLISISNDFYSITEAGKEQAEALWTLSKKAQDNKFNQFTKEEISIFKKVVSNLAFISY